LLEVISISTGHGERRRGVAKVPLPRGESKTFCRPPATHWDRASSPHGRWPVVEGSSPAGGMYGFFPPPGNALVSCEFARREVAGEETDRGDPARRGLGDRLRDRPGGAGRRRFGGHARRRC